MYKNGTEWIEPSSRLTEPTMWFSVHSKIRSSCPLLSFTVHSPVQYRYNWIENIHLCVWYNSTETTFSSLLHTRLVTPQKPPGAAQLIATETHSVFFFKAHRIGRLIHHSLYATLLLPWREIVRHILHTVKEAGVLRVRICWTLCTCVSTATDRQKTHM